MTTPTINPLLPVFTGSNFRTLAICEVVVTFATSNLAV